MKKTITTCLLLLFLSSTFLLAQRLFTGTVTNQFGEPLIGANVSVKYFAGIGTVTDPEGHYSLLIPEGAMTLVFSYIGFNTLERAIGPGNQLDVILNEGLQLDEIVVTGYGSQKRTDVSGAITKLAGTDIRGIAATGIDGALQGKVPGLLLTSNTGQPGAGMTTRIRGNSSINAGNDPLYVVDGIPFTTGNFSQANFGGMDFNVLADLNPNDIESIEVLKDAASASIYGSRASNGVMLITTKRGAAGKAKFNAGYSRGWQSDINRWDMLSGQQFSELTNIPWNGKDANFEGELYRTAPVSDYYLSVSGGDLKTKYYLGGSYFDQQGTFVEQSFDRLSSRLNFEHRATDWLKLEARVSMTKTKTSIVPSDDNLSGAVTMMLLQPRNVDIFDAGGGYSLEGYFFENPVGTAVLKTNLLNTRRTLANLGAQFQLSKKLAFQSRLGLDITDFRERVYNPVTTFQGGGQGGQAFLNTTVAERTVYQNYFDFQTQISRGRVGILAGIDFETFAADNTRAAGNGFPSPQFTYLVSAAQYTNAAQEVTNNSLLSYYTRTNFSWLDKYVVTATLRADGSSKFGANNRYGFFPSVSLGWKLAKEPFLANLGIFNNLKLRASYGQTGNQAGIGNFAARGLSLGGNNYQGQPGVAPGTLANPDLRWETTNELNFGLDFGLWKDRLNGSFDFYIKNTKDLLLKRPIPPTSGFSGFDQNVGRMSNRGVELGVNGLLIDRAFQWSLGCQVAANKNEVVELYIGQGFNTSPFLPIRVDEGQPLAYFFGWKSLGVNPETGDLVFEDVNKDGQINESDNQFIGSPHPDFMGSVRSDFSFRGFYLNAFFNFVQGNEVLNYTRVFVEDGLTRGFNNSTRILDAWEQPGDQTGVFRRGGPNAANNQNPSTSHWVEDGSFIRLKSVRLGYQFPAGFLGKLGLSDLNVYLSGENLFTWTNYSGLDPEANYNGTDNLILGTDFFTQGLNRTFKFGIFTTF